MLAILDYGAGNQTSVARSLAHLGIPCKITADAVEIHAANGVIFPGVGAASQAMAHLRASGLDASLKRTVAEGQPLLGICLGCQILLDRSEEGPTDMLGLLPGNCARFDASLEDETGRKIQIPHMGWNSLETRRPTPLLDGIDPGAEFYFVHSYYTLPSPELVLATTSYGLEFCSLYGRDGLWAAQFHPEKSGKPGLRLLSNFYEWCLAHGRQAAGALPE